MSNKPEYWQQGPIENIIPQLQPVVHAILQARDEMQLALVNFPERLLWNRPARVASVAFHLQHVTGVLDRLFTYARGEQLTVAQLDYLKSEGVKDESATLSALLSLFREQVDKAILQLKQTDESALLAFRGVGRKQIPANTIGLLFHAAEHLQRHLGQLLVTVKWVQHHDAMASE